MRAFVFTDASLARYAGQFVWLSVDTENAANTAFLKKFPINVWPTLLIVDPKAFTVVREPGGHHFAGRYAEVGDAILANLNGAPASSPAGPPASRRRQLCRTGDKKTTMNDER